MEREKLTEEMAKIVGKRMSYRQRRTCCSMVTMPLSSGEGLIASSFRFDRGCFQDRQVRPRGGGSCGGRGSGTNLSGGTIPTKGGIVIHFSRMNRILEIDIENQRAVWNLPSLHSL